MASSNNTSIIDYSCLSGADYQEEMKHEALCAEMNDIVGGFLCQTYPGYPWGVNSNVRNGVINIFLMLRDGGRGRFGMTIKIDAQIHVVLTKVKHFGGELLERYGLRRGAMDADELGRLLETADFAGRIKVDES